MPPHDGLGPHGRQFGWRSENLWITWSKRLGHASISTLRAMAKTCDGMEDLKLAPIPRNYVSPESRMGKLVNLDVPKHVTTRATQPMEKIHMDLKGPMTTPSFNGHKYIIIFVDDHSLLSNQNQKSLSKLRDSLLTLLLFGRSSLGVVCVAITRVKTHRM